MKKLCVIFLLTLLPMAASTQIKRTINVETPGTLPNLIQNDEKYEIEELTLTGELNGTDIRFIRHMSGVDYRFEDDDYYRVSTPGKLKNLDISNAKIVSGGENYYRRSTSQYEYAFYCFNREPPTLISSGIDKEKCVLWVPKGCIAAYKATDGWKDFMNIKEIADGDVNLDNKVNKDDLDALVAHIMGESPKGFYEDLADLNGDDKINAADIVKFIDTINSYGLSTESQLYFDNVDGNLVVSSLTCTLNNERDKVIQLTKCELYCNGKLVSYKNFSGSSASVASGGSKPCSFDNLAKLNSSTGFTVSWHYTINGESFVYHCPLTDQ